ncbi:transcription factor ORG2-like isoform X2 [Juglans microcarpa x Juglans regia]|uniref:transcription factor ORG2-like isoform X2 n=1 Tax=Juglans microcarpa x Juglans regia TaxID=2249226 RepID=UPI001B7E5010|nr:transcription factor ORG2-like isoform X2 [Juglans microcarpa x Juglans regia]
MMIISVLLTIQVVSNCQPNYSMMLALSPPSWFSNNGSSSYFHQYSISQDQNYVHRDNDTLESALHFHSYETVQEVGLDPATAPTPVSHGDPKMVKKFNHNASERDRRKKMNGLYSSLRSLLPEADQMKLSIPTTVSRVLKYIPELQKQVVGLIQNKEELLSMISRQTDIETQNEHEMNQPKTIGRSSLSTVSASRLNDTEVMIQISTCKIDNNTPLSEILLSLEEVGLLLLNVSSFESFGGRVFYGLHLQGERNQRLECEILSERLMSLYDKREAPLP